MTDCGIRYLGIKIHHWRKEIINKEGEDRKRDEKAIRFVFSGQSHRSKKMVKSL